MNRFKLSVMCVGVFLLMVSSLSAGIYVTTSGPGAGPGDTIYCEHQVTFDVHLLNDWTYPIQGFTNGFRIFSPDSATWNPLVCDTTGGLADFFDLGVFLNEFSVTGSGVDTVGLGAVAMSGGLPIGYDEIVMTIKTQVSAVDTGRTLCIDSTWYPPGGIWKWVSSTSYDISPSWSGPHCFTISTGSSQPTVPGITMHVTGPGAGPDTTLYADRMFTFNIRLYNGSGSHILGMTNGFRVYSPDGAMWLPIVSDTVGDLSAYLDGGVFINEFGITGYGDDTVGIGGFAMFTNGIPPEYDATVLTITSRVDSQFVGKTLCIDSTFYPPTGYWLWSLTGSVLATPDWSGPHCFNIIQDTTMPPVEGITSSLSGPGAAPGDSIRCGQPITFDINLYNGADGNIYGLTNGFRIFSPNGATWNPLTWDTSGGLGDVFDGGVFVNLFSNTGSGADTIGLGGFKMFGTGIPVGYDNNVLHIHTQVGQEHVGKTLCIDSSYYPPAGAWLWSVGTDGVIPSWDGPYCYPIIEGWNEGPFDSLLIPSVTTGPCQAVQPVAVKLTQPIKGASIPLAIPSGVRVDSISFAGLMTENWDFTIKQVKPDSGFLIVVLANSQGLTIPVGENTVFRIYFDAETSCLEPGSVRWDTTLSTDAMRQLLFSDANNQDLGVGFNSMRDITTIPGYMPGDFDMDGQVLVSDLTLMVAYLFTGGSPPCVLNTIDVNGSCTGPNVADLTYLVDYLFQSGPAPQCGCLTLAKKQAPPRSDTDIIMHAVQADGFTTIYCRTEVALRGVQLKLSGPADAAPISLLNDKFDLISGQSGSTVKLGLLDLRGEAAIMPGQHELVRIAGNYELVEAIVADTKHQDFMAALSKEVMLPTEFGLSQNYPNPFNPVTEISFSLPKAADVTLTVFNIMGQRVAVLADGSYEAGTYTVTWSGSNDRGQTLASGVYFYRLQTDGFTQSKKMLLLK